MDISYRLNNNQIKKLEKYNNLSIIFKKRKYFEKWKIQITFNGWYV